LPKIKLTCYFPIVFTPLKSITIPDTRIAKAKIPNNQSKFVLVSIQFLRAKFLQHSQKTAIAIFIVYYCQKAYCIFFYIPQKRRRTMDYRNYITIEPDKRGGKPCVRGLRITVYEVLEYLASEMTEVEILEDFPDLTREDLKACIAYAADRERRLMTASIAV
jgi:uncharacterized protein (DUF433 family)